MGKVSVADDLNLNRRVALKFLPGAFTGDPERMVRFEREAKLLASRLERLAADPFSLEYSSDFLEGSLNLAGGKRDI
jgi:hypothetical protein